MVCFLFCTSLYLPYTMATLLHAEPRQAAVSRRVSPQKEPRHGCRPMGHGRTWGRRGRVCEKLSQKKSTKPRSLWRPPSCTQRRASSLSCRAGDAVPNPWLSGLAFGSHLELNPSSTRPRGLREDAGDGTGAEICVAHICLGSHHAFVEDGLSASASWPKSSLRHRTSCPKVPCGFHSEMPPWLALPRCQAASRRCQAELGSTAEVHQDMCPHVGP